MFRKRFPCAWHVALAALLLLFAGAIHATTVRMQTTLGIVDIQLYDTAAPLTVANFLNYVNSGAYNNSFIHRSVPGFIIQGGGYTWNSTTNGVASVTTAPPVANEYSPSRSNLRGTIAMAKQATNPNSATSQWFFSLANNSNLDNQNGGFTVFGRVLGNGMSVVDGIAALKTVPVGTVFESLPLATPPTSINLQKANLVIVDMASASSPTASESDRVFSYLEAAYPQYLSPANPLSPAASFSATAEGYYYRYYPGTNAFIGTADGALYYYGPASGNQILPLGPLPDWTATAASAGY